MLKKIFLYLLAIFMLAAGIHHFVNTEFLLRMMPPFLPYPLILVQVSGVVEILLGLLLLIPKYTRLAAWACILLFLAVFPANIYMALAPEKFPDFPRWALYLRLPLQLLPILWAYWFTRPMVFPSPRPLSQGSR